MASPQLPPPVKHRISVFPTETLMNANIDSLKEHSNRLWKYWQKVEAAIRLRESD